MSGRRQPARPGDSGGSIGSGTVGEMELGHGRTEPAATEPAPHRRRSRWVAWAALCGYVAVGFFPYLVSGLVVPPGAVVVLMVAWLLGLGLAVWLSRVRPLLVPAVVVLALVFWFAFVSVGEALFGWTA